MFFWIFFYYYDNTFSVKTVYLRKSGKTGSLNELKTPVKRFQFLDNQTRKNGPARKRFRVYRKLQKCIQKALREAKTRENDRFIKDQ